MYGKGISREGSLLDVALELGFVKKSGAWFTYEGEQLGQGRENVKTFLSENPQLMAEINDRVRECLNPKEDSPTSWPRVLVDRRRRADLDRLLAPSWSSAASQRQPRQPSDPPPATAASPGRSFPLPRVTGRGTLRVWGLTGRAKPEQNGPWHL